MLSTSCLSPIPKSMIWQALYRLVQLVFASVPVLLMCTSSANRAKSLDVGSPGRSTGQLNHKGRVGWFRRI